MLDLKNTQITQQEAELLASLKNDPAYLLLLSKLQYLLDNVTDELYTGTAAQTADLLPYWKALKTIVNELRNTPAEVGNYLQTLDSKDRISPDIDPRVNKALQAYVAKLERAQLDTQNSRDQLHDMYYPAKPSPV